MRHCTSLDTFPMEGRGLVLTVQMPADLWEPGHLKGTDCTIAGTPSHINGVASFCIHRSPTQPYRLNIDLLGTPSPSIPPQEEPRLAAPL
jgi:hypothetical protein